MLDVVANSKQLNEMEILSQLEKIMKMAENAEERLPPLGILTSDGRTEWAQARDALIKGLSSNVSLIFITFRSFKTVANNSQTKKNQDISHRLPSSIQIKPTGTLWPWLRAVCVWCVWMSPVAWSLGIPTGPCWCCMVAAVRRMGRTAGMTNQCR